MSHINISDEIEGLLCKHYEYINQKGALEAYNLKLNLHNGHFQAIGIPANGAILVQSDTLFFDDTSVYYEALEDSYVVMIPSATTKFINKRTQKSLLLKKQSLSLIASKAKEPYIMEHKGDERHNMIEFCISKEVLKTYLKELENSTLLARIEQGDFEMVANAPLYHAHSEILHKIATNPYNGELRRIYFENCVNELLLSILHAFAPLPAHTSIRFTEEDREMILKAEKILRENFQTPPTIPELCKMVATNKDKLTKGFRILFDQTIFDTLLYYRMQNARHHLASTSMNINEVAYECGYRSTSSFIKAFKKHYGITPKQFQTQKSRTKSSQ